MRAILTGQLDPSTLAKRRVQSHYRPVRQLPDVPPGMPGQRRYPAADDRRQRSLRARQRAVDFRLGHVAHRPALPLGQRVLAAGQSGTDQSRRRWLLEKTIGLAQGRKLPRFATRSFMRLAARRRLTRSNRRSGRKVVYFVDTFANYHDPQLGEALVAVMEHNGIAVFVHPAQGSSGMPMISLGALGRSQTPGGTQRGAAGRGGPPGLSRRRDRTLGCAGDLTREYPALLDDDEARLVAENASEACSYLWKLHQAGTLQLDLRPSMPPSAITCPATSKLSASAPRARTCCGSSPDWSSAGSRRGVPAWPALLD